MARPRAKIDIEEVEKLYSMLCTDDEVAAFVGVSTPTLRRRMRQKKFRETVERAKARGKVSVRRNLFRMASNGNVAAAIFLAKNILGYRDVVANEHTGPQGGPIQLAAKPNLSQLTDDELRQLQTIALKSLPAARD